MISRVGGRHQHLCRARGGRHTSARDGHFHSCHLPDRAASEKYSLPRRQLQGQCAKALVLLLFRLDETSFEMPAEWAASYLGRAAEAVLPANWSLNGLVDS